MNCKNVEPLLSLYVGRDLEEEHSRLVAAHLQSCTKCALAADEYAGASQLLQAYEPPFFSDEIYAGIREQVLNKIERESQVPVSPGLLSQLLLALVQPRMRWVTAALLLAISVTALYLSRNSLRQPRNDQQVAVQTREPNQGGSNSNASSGSSSFSNKATRRSPITRKREANPRVVATNRSRGTTKVDSATNDGVVQRVVGITQPPSAPAPLRVELQTSDRNIRIIWLSGQRHSAGGRDGSKGI
jgi:Putative zinc-finger